MARPLHVVSPAISPALMRSVASGLVVLAASCSSDDELPGESVECPARGRLLLDDGGDQRCAVVVECADTDFSVRCDVSGADDAGTGGTFECRCLEGNIETKTVPYDAVWCEDTSESNEGARVAAAVSKMESACGFDIPR